MALWRGRWDGSRGLLGVFVIAWLCGLEQGAEANGIFRNGVGARAMALGGADAAWAEDALGAMAANPAGLGFLTTPTLNLSLTAVTADGRFRNPVNDDGDLSGDPGFVPDGAFALRLGPVAVGIALIPESLLFGDWQYNDTPGGLGGKTTYGLQQHKSGIVVLRSAVGLGVSLGPNFALGGSIGLVYNENTLEAPYVFQSHPILKGFKTLLDLETSGYGWNGSVGLLYRPHETVQLGLAYKSETTVHSDGRASGNAAAQLAALGVPFRPDFRYDAEVTTVFPQMVTGGLSWKFHPRWRLALQVDWINWSDAFDDLPIKLTNGNNADINGFVGSDTLEDTVPLKWRDRFVYRIGLEYTVRDNLWLRAGYAYGKSPVPSSTLLPLTAVIVEHTLTAGVGYRRGRYQVDLAYQLDVPRERRVGTSGLLAGEYSQSRTEVGLHWVGLTASIRF
ncbi:MAG: OmpP1/FadL family transporter [Candidatus Rokuibacteriota bacterium]